MTRFLCFVAVALVAGCDAAVPPELPPGCGADGMCVMLQADQTRANTPRMGFVTGVSGAQSLTWETYDFSIGAFDASAFMTDDDGPVRLRIRGYDPEDEELRGTFRIDIRGDLQQGVAIGPGVDVVVSVVDDRGNDGPRYASVEGAVLTVTGITRDGEDAYGTIAGNFAGRLCRAVTEDAAPDLSDCRDLTGQFDTTVQFDNM